MAIEPRRGCGFRKVGGLYLVGDSGGFSCDRLPFPLTICPTCGAGIKPSLGWTWIFGHNLLGGVHENCKCNDQCPICHPAKMGRRSGLMWVGSSFYTPNSFAQEAIKMGVSKRISTVPKDLELGSTWVLLAHRQVVPVEKEGPLFDMPTLGPGIFFAFIPQRIEKIVTESQSKDESLIQRLQARGITPVVVPDDDQDHQ